MDGLHIPNIKYRISHPSAARACFDPSTLSEDLDVVSHGSFPHAGSDGRRESYLHSR